MITTVTLNPCIDHTVIVNNISQGGFNSVSQSRNDFGGKGLNVSAALSNFGINNTAFTLDFLDSGREFSSWLSMQSFSRRLIPVPGKIRTNIKIFDESTSEMTEFNEKGEFIQDSTLSTIWSALMDSARNTHTFVLSGSTCPGIPTQFYADVIQAVRSINPQINIVLDASGPSLIAALSASPTVIKPNLFELETAFNIKLTSPNEIANCAQSLCTQYGIGIVCVSMGKDGAMIASSQHSYQADGLSIPIQSAQGAGDAMVAGLCRGIEENQDLSGLLRFGMSSAAATICQPGTLMGSETDFRRFFPQVVIHPIL